MCWRRRRWSYERCALRDRHRPRHHPQRTLVRRPAGQRRREGRPGRAAGPAADRPRRGRAAAAAAVLPLPAAPGRDGAGRTGAALVERRAGACSVICRWRDGAQSRRRHADPPGLVGEKLAEPPERGPPRRHPAAGRTAGSRARLAAGRLHALPRTHPQRLERRASGSAVRPAGRHRHDSGLVRSGRARADRRSRAQRRLPQPDPAGRAAGRAVQLDPGQRRALAQASQSRRHRAGGRRRRRHQRLLADRHPRTRGQAGAAPRGRGRPHPAGRRQHGPGAGPPGGAQAAGERHPARRLADARPHLRLPRRQGTFAGRRQRRC